MVSLPFILRQDLQVQEQAHLTERSVSAPKIVRQLQVPFLDHFWSQFWALIWGHFSGRNGIKNWTRFWTASCSSFGGNLGGILAVLGRSWDAPGRPGRGQEYQNLNPKRIFHVFLNVIFHITFRIDFLSTFHRFLTLRNLKKHAPVEARARFPQNRRFRDKA